MDGWRMEASYVVAQEIASRIKLLNKDHADKKEARHTETDCSK